MGRTYEELNKHAKDSRCFGCPLHSIGASFARTDGSGRSGVALVGEALGEAEALASKPFQGDSGYQLNAVLHRANLKRDDFLIMNAINCHPPNNYLDGAPYELGAIQHCSRYFDETLERHPEIKVLVAMGNTAMYKLLGQRGIAKFHSSIHWSERYGRYVIPALHPSAVLRGGGKESVTLLFSIKRAVDLAHTGKFERSPVDYLLRPTVDQLGDYIERYESQLARDSDTILAADIETNYSSGIDEDELLEKDPSYDITRISFSFQSNSAITFPWNGNFRGLAMRLLSTSGELWFWNGNKFDVPRLRAAGASITNARIIDGMDAWHVLRPDLPRGLAYVSPFFTDIAPWKHLNNSEPEFYSCVDSDALYRIAIKLREAHKRDGTWITFLSHWAALEPRLQRMSEIGIGVNESKRLERQAYYEDIRDNTAERLQALIPNELKPRAKEAQGGFKGKPKDVRAFIQTNKETIKDESEAWRACGYTQHRLSSYRAAYREGQEDVWRWDRVLPFNHNSANQIKDYLRFKHGPGAVPKHKKTGSETTGADELERIARRFDDPVLHHILDAGRADSYISSFIKPWAAGLDGRVHGTFTNVPSTPRLASQNPNLQNFPIRDTEAGELRKMIVPGDGWEFLVEADYVQGESIMVGWYANDQDYIRLALNGGVHSYFAARKLKLDVSLQWSDADLRLGLKEAKKIAKKKRVAGSDLYDCAKRTVHGSSYLEGALLLHKTFPEIWESTASAQYDQDFFFEVVGKKIQAWQQQVIDQCHETCYVQNAWGIKRWFYNAKRWQYIARLGKWVLVPYLDPATKRWVGHSEDAKKAVATIPQGSLGMVMRGAVLSDAAQELIDQQCLMLTVHDSLVARARNKKHLDWVIEKLQIAMAYPIKEMSNIVVPVDIKIGASWGEVQEV